MKTLTFSLLFSLLFASLAQTKEKPRIFVGESNSSETKGTMGGDKNGIWGRIAGGSRPQTAEIIKTFGEKCECIVTNNKEKADYLVVLEHEGGKGMLMKDNKYALFNKDGDVIKSGSTRSLGNAVKEACAAMLKDWESKPEKK